MISNDQVRYATQSCITQIVSMAHMQTYIKKKDKFRKFKKMGQLQNACQQVNSPKLGNG